MTTESIFQNSEPIRNTYFIIAMFFFAFIHETGHLAMAKLLGYKVAGFSVGIFGYSLRLKEWEISPTHQLLIHLAGPCTNIIIACVLLYLGKAINAAYANMILAIFNLIPVFPLDGGKIVNIFISQLLSKGTAYRISLYSSGIFSFFLFIMGIYLIQYNILNIMIVPVAVNLYRVSHAEADYLLYGIIRSNLRNNERKVKITTEKK